MKKQYFLTGVTGVLGQDLIRKLLKTTEHDLHILVRSSRKLSAEQRVIKILEDGDFQSELGKRVFVYEGDVTQKRFGLSEETLNTLSVVITEFFHIAALTALNGSEEDCNAINIEGTRHALEIAWKFKNEGILERFIYFSTAYVAGSKKQCHSLERELPKDPGFANFYESSKYKSETEVREAINKGLPTTIIRPSIVVGDSITGKVSDFNVIYPFFKLFAHGAFSKLIAHASDEFNIVPIDFVIDATCHIVNKPESLGRAYHLVSKKPPTMGMLLKLKEECYPEVPDIELIAPEDFDESTLTQDERYIYTMMQPYLGYSNQLLSFDTTETDEILKDSSIKFPSTDYEFLKLLIEYAVDVGYLIVK